MATTSRLASSRRPARAVKYGGGRGGGDRPFELSNQALLAVGAARSVFVGGQLGRRHAADGRVINTDKRGEKVE